MRSAVEAPPRSPARPGPGAGGPDPARPRVAGLVLVPLVASVVIALVAWWAVGGGAAAPGPAGTAALPAAVRAADRAFLDTYETSSGRVVRRDQGGDTVSEGQAYAMLVAVALGDRPAFDAAWRWASGHLRTAGGLLAWHWQAGRVVDDQPAADADLDAAWALRLAATRFGEPADAAAGGQLAAAALAAETVPTAAGRVLVAGPWARAPVRYLDPSYGDPTALAALADADPAWAPVAAGTRTALHQLLGGGLLPSDWAVLDGSGTAHPTAAPGRTGAPVLYGYDAARVPVLLAASCDPGDRALAAGLWRTLGRLDSTGPDLVLDLGGHPDLGGASAPVGLVARAGAAAAAGDTGAARALLGRARSALAARPDYYSAAWVALGGTMLETRALGNCPPM